MTDISFALKRSSIVYQNDPLFIIASSTSNHQKEQEEQHLTYHVSWEIAKRHEAWIQHQIQALIQDRYMKAFNNAVSGSGSNFADDNVNADRYINVDVVVAYLAPNSPDLLLSMIGSMNATTSTITISLQKAGETKCCKYRCRIIPAMLNARWTHTEIASALQVHSTATSNSNPLCIGENYGEIRQEHLTMLVYGRDFQKTAKQACSILLNDSDQMRLRHGVGVFPLPQFASTSLSTSIFTAPYRQNHMPQSANASQGSYRQVKRQMQTELKKNDNGIITHATSYENDNIQTNINEDALLLFTSGTTSGAKGVRLSHLSLLIQAFAKTANPSYLYDKRTIMLATTVPFFHVGGVSSALALIMTGGCLVFPPNNNDDRIIGGFDPKVAIQSIRTPPATHKLNDGIKSQCQVNTLVLVPAMLHSILHENNQNQKEENEIFPNVRLLLIGGQSLTQPQLESSKIIFPNSRIVQTYACTEAGSSITFANIHDPSTAAASTTDAIDQDEELKESRNIPHGVYAGIPPPHIEIKIFPVDEETNEVIMNNNKDDTSPYVVGVIGTRGPHVMSGYWNRSHDVQSEVNNKKDGSTCNQWMMTNDLGYLDLEGGLYFCGRANDVIRTGGESVLAPEVESILVEHPQIDSCCVFALPHPRFGECVCAAIVVKTRSLNFHENGTEAKENIERVNYYDNNLGFESNATLRDELRTFCKNRNLSGYKRPVRVFVLRDLPRNSSGKVLKRDVIRICKQLQSRIKTINHVPNQHNHPIQSKL